jgi:hypothetical protein
MPVLHAALLEPRFMFSLLRSNPYRRTAKTLGKSADLYPALFYRLGKKRGDRNLTVRRELYESALGTRTNSGQVYTCKVQERLIIRAHAGDCGSNWTEVAHQGFPSTGPELLRAQQCILTAGYYRWYRASTACRNLKRLNSLSRFQQYLPNPALQN